MITKTFHGNITADKLADALVARFSHGNLVAKKQSNGEQTIIQIATQQNQDSGGKTALGITIQNHQDGVVVKLGKQEWLGIAASLGTTLIALSRNPMSILGRMDDIAEDIENINLDDRVWEVIDEVAVTLGASHQISESLRRLTCPYCGTANSVGQGSCMACGAPLGDEQPDSCLHCGYVNKSGAKKCKNCKIKLD